MKVCSIDGITAEFYGECPTLVVQDRDEPGQVADMTTMLAQANINIATMQPVPRCERRSGSNCN